MMVHTERGRSHWLLTAAPGLALAVITVLVYLPVRQYSFVDWDDFDYVSQNDHVKGGLTRNGLVWAFTQNHSGNWHPLTWISHMMDCQLFGLQAGAHHLVNVGFHVANALLLLAFLRSVTGAAGRSAFAAALFALHPLHVESVAWISERKDVLSTFFFLLTLKAYAKYAALRTANQESRVPRSSIFYVLSLALFACGLMSKPMVVTIPFVLLLLDFWPLRRMRLLLSSISPTAPSLQHSTTPLPRLVYEKLPFFLLSALSCLVTLLVQSRSGAVLSLHTLPVWERVANVPVAYAAYLRLFLWPVDLSPIYLRPEHWSGWAVGGSTFLLALITAVSCRLWRRFPWLLMGWLWFFGTLVPVIGLVQVGYQAFADRYTYIPLIGVIVAVTWLGAEALAVAQRAVAPAIGQAAARAFSAALAVVLLGLAAWASAGQVRIWQNTETLFRRALLLQPGCVPAMKPLGLYLVKHGSPEEGLRLLQEAVQLAPDDADLRAALAYALDELGRHSEAVQSYRAALERAPDQPRILNNLAWLEATSADTSVRDPSDAVRLATRACELTHYTRPLTLRTLSAAQAAAGDLPAAIATAERAVTLASELGLNEEAGAFRLVAGDLCFRFGLQLQSQGKGADAIAFFEKAEVPPAQRSDRDYRLGLSLLAANRLPEAETALANALKAQPDNPEYQLGRATLLHSQGHSAEAEQVFRDVLAAHPDLVQARQAYAHFLFEMAEQLSSAGRSREAIEKYDHALSVSPDLVSVLNNLAWLLATAADSRLRDGKRAVQLSERACRLNEWRSAMLIGTLAAAYAEAGQFPEAVSTAGRARDRARADKLDDVARKNEELLRLYLANKPYHESAP